MFNSKAPCPYCYQHIDPASPHYRCTGRPAPGKEPCVKKDDPVRAKKLEDSTPVFPSFAPPQRQIVRVDIECPDCGGVTGIRVCPNCHSVLPANFTSKSPLFGIVGVRGSGKTVMISVLGKELTTNVARRFDASIHSVGSSALLDRLTDVRNNLDTGGLLPDQTSGFTLKNTVPAVYEWQGARGSIGPISRTTSTILSFYDTAGEDLAVVETAREQHYLGAADGLILLLDPFGFPRNRDEALERGVDPDSLKYAPIDVLGGITDSLREKEQIRPGKKIKKPIAVVLAKIDAYFDQVGPDHPIRRPSSQLPAFDEKESLDLHNHVAALIDEWGGSDVLALLRHGYATWRLFGASALGAEPDYRNRRPDSSGVRPHRVAEPLLWLMARRGFVKTVK